MVVFADRIEAGRALAGRLEHLRGKGPVILGLPRGGVPVAFEVARALEAPLDVIVVRKLGAPLHPELAMGAIGEGGATVLEATVLVSSAVSDADLAGITRREQLALAERVALLRKGRARIDLTGRVVVVVDDGMATGSTMRVACEVARSLGAARVIAAVPVASVESTRHLEVADELVCVAAPPRFRSVSAHYRDFSPTSDDDVIALLDEAATHPPVPSTGSAEGGVGTDVEIPAGGLTLAGHLVVPARPRGVVVFAHGSGSSRHSPRNRHVASVLNEAHVATLLVDLRSPREATERDVVFDVPLLADRLGAAVRWLGERPDVGGCRIGCFGASTGAAAALWTAGQPGTPIAAVVARGGRPDLAAERLADVEAPTLLIVGSADTTVLTLNRQALVAMHCPRRLAVVEGATHLFEEPGTLDEAAILARDWFAENLTGG